MPAPANISVTQGLWRLFQQCPLARWITWSSFFEIPSLLKERYRVTRTRTDIQTNAGDQKT